MNRGANLIERLPEWIQRFIEQGQPINRSPLRRKSQRHEVAGVASAERESAPSPKFNVTLADVSEGGIRLISREELQPREIIQITPLHMLDAVPVRLRVVHCTRTLQGFKVGCTFEA